MAVWVVVYSGGLACSHFNLLHQTVIKCGYNYTCFYHFVKRTNGYELFEDLNEPLSPKYNCVAVSDNHAKVMIEIQHGGSLILVFNEAKSPDNTLKLFEG